MVENVVSKRNYITIKLGQEITIKSRVRLSNNRVRNDSKSDLYLVNRTKFKSTIISRNTQYWLKLVVEFSTSVTTYTKLEFSIPAQLGGFTLNPRIRGINAFGTRRRSKNAFSLIVSINSTLTVSNSNSMWWGRHRWHRYLVHGDYFGLFFWSCLPFCKS